jgi:alpha-glucosidase
VDQALTNRLAAESAESWWRSGVIYQIYPRSFADANNDGTGDLAGITSRLSAVRALGVDAIWLSPFYRSPMRDGGYDVADYRSVDPLFGTLADFDALLGRAHELGLRVLIDLVPNHCSSEHEWFRAALVAAPGSPERARFHFADGRGQQGELPPNNWVSMFGGPAWSRVPDPDGQPGQWYLHLFDSSQPDFNWQSVEVQAEFEDILRFWLDRGVDGFRVDQPHAMAKAAGLPDHPYLAEAGAGFIEGREHPPMWFQDEVHPIFRRWREILDGYPGERAMCAEAYAYPLSLMAKWVRPDEFHQTFNFRFLDAGWQPGPLRAAIDESLEAFGAVGAPSTWVLSNHDVIRHASRFGGDYGRATASDGIGPGATQPDADLGLARARAATLFMLALPGASYLFQGEELGLPEHSTLAAEFRQDPTFARTAGARVGRDGCRIPLPWQAGLGTANGFNETGAAWLPQPERYRELAYDQQLGVAGSTLELYRAALALRRERRLGSGDFGWLADYCGENALGFENRGVWVLHNFGSEPIALPVGRELLIASGELPLIAGGARSLGPNQTVWLG